MEFARRIDAAELNNLPLRSYEGPIRLVSNKKDFRSVLPALKASNILGFDTETRPSFKKGVIHKVSLLQLATENEVILIRVSQTGLPQELVKILADPDIIKAGAAIRDDVKSLIGLKPFKPAGFIDLQEEVKKLNFENFSLKKMAALTLGFRISKSQQLSNWDAEKLTDQQLVYAATDAWVSRKIYLALKMNLQII